MATPRPVDPFEPMSIDLLKNIAKFMKLLNLRRILNNAPNQALHELPDETRLDRTFTLVRQSHQDALGVRLRDVTSARTTEVRVIFAGQGRNRLFNLARDVMPEVFFEADNFLIEPGIVVFAENHKTATIFTEYLEPFFDAIQSKGFPASSFLKLLSQDHSGPIFVSHRSDGEWSNYARVTVSLGPPKSIEELLQILKIGARYHIILCPQERSACEKLLPIVEFLDFYAVHPSCANDPTSRQICPAGKQIVKTLGY